MYMPIMIFSSSWSHAIACCSLMHPGYLLGDEKNSDLLLSFINSVHEDYDLPLIKSVIIKNPFNLKNLANEKESVIDIKAEDESGRQYDIEVQVEGNSLYY